MSEVKLSARGSCPMPIRSGLTNYHAPSRRRGAGERFSSEDPICASPTRAFVVGADATVSRFVSGANDGPSPLEIRKARYSGQIGGRLLYYRKRNLPRSDHRRVLSGRVRARTTRSKDRAGTKHIFHLNRKNRSGLNSLIGAHSALSPVRLCRAACGI